MAQLDWMHWGVIVSTAFFGITAAQGWTYFNNNNDKWHLRLLITVLILLDLGTTCLNSIILRDSSIAIPSDSAPTSIVRIICIQRVLTIVVVFLVESFFAFQVYLLGKRSWYTPAVIMGCAFGSLASMIFVVDYCLKHSLVVQLTSPQVKLGRGMAIGFSAMANLITTAALCRKISSRGTGAPRTKTALHQLLLYSFTRGVLVTLNEVVHLILFVIGPTTLYWMPFQFLSCRLYVNTTLAMLNARLSLRTQMDADAMDPSKCMPPIYFEDRQAPSQQSDAVPIDITSSIVVKHKIQLGATESSETISRPS